MKNSTKRLLVSLGFLAIALIVTTTTTFAWFSFNNKVSVTGISATVTAQDGLYISTTETGVYGTTLVASNCFINGVDGTTVGAAKYELKDLTTTDSGATLKTKLGAAAQAYAAATTEPAVAEKKGAYVEFAFWLKSSSNYDVYLAKESTVTSSHTGTIGGAGNTPDIKAWMLLLLQLILMILQLLELQLLLRVIL
jgi:hypothetical protein